MDGKSCSGSPVVCLENDTLVRRLRAGLATDQAVEWIPAQDLYARLSGLPAAVICIGGPLWSENAERLLDTISNRNTLGVVVLCTKDGEESERGVPVSSVIDTVDVRNTGQSFRSILRLGHIIQERKQKQRLEENLKKQTRNLSILNEVGKALGAEHNPDRLLDLILTHARRICSADAGSIYILRSRTTNGGAGVPEELGETYLYFAHTQSDTLDLPHHGRNIEISPNSMAGYVALTGEIINLPDLYDLPPNTPYKHDTSFDESVGYRTVSMLCLPMRNAENRIIGVLQLINRKIHPEAVLRPPERAQKEVIPFTEEDENLGLAVAGQAAVALENGLLYESIERLFEGFVRASVQAIESRDPPTSGHSERVALLTVALAEAVSAVSKGPLGNLKFSPDQMQELRYAALLHDFGKVGTREHVLVKAKKLYPSDWNNLVTRLDFVKRTIQVANYRQRVELLSNNGREEYSDRLQELDEELEQNIGEINTFFTTLDKINSSGFLSDEARESLEEIKKCSYEDMDGATQPLLTPQEIVNLSIPRGTLNDEERLEIQAHVTHTFHFLQTIPWTRTLLGVPEIAHGHHEKQDGTGYERGISGPDILPQSRMMAVADIFDALTAADRPYKRAVPVPKALEILEKEAEANHLDPDLVRLFIDAKIYKRVIPPKEE
ncbi:MAG: HD domain-containing phosphohydrolase [bacterium]